MRLLLRAGILLALAAAACKETVTPVDFKDPVALSANLSSVDSAVNTQVARSFSTECISDLNVGFKWMAQIIQQREDEG